MVWNDGVVVGDDHLGACVYELRVRVDHVVGALDEGQRRPLGLAERCADSPQKFAHPAVENGD
jgi:hypothetical protein